MAVTISVYEPARLYIVNGTVDLDGDTLKLALVSSAYTYSAAHDEWADASANEVANGAGYTTGGASLAGVSVSRSGTVVTFDATDTTFTALTKTFRAGILYANVTRNGVTDPLLAYILFNDTPADTVISGTDFTVTWNASGIIQYA